MGKGFARRDARRVSARIGAGLDAGCHAVPWQCCQLAEAPSTDTAEPVAALPDFVVLAQPPCPACLPRGLRQPQPAALHPGCPAARQPQRVGGGGQGLRAVPQLQLRLHRRECGTLGLGEGDRGGGVTPLGVLKVPEPPSALPPAGADAAALPDPAACHRRRQSAAPGALREPPSAAGKRRAGAGRAAHRGARGQLR